MFDKLAFDKQAILNSSATDFEKIFDDIISLKTDHLSTKNFLLTLNQAELPQNAFLGAVAALRKKMRQVSTSFATLDVCGTGGDKLNTLNISTAVAFVVAACGVKVAKHGNRANSSKSGSSDILSELGIRFNSSAESINHSLEHHNLCFLFAPDFHESLKNVAAIRKEIAQEYNTPTIFNFLGPLLNPLNAQYQLIGTSKREVMSKMLEVTKNNNVKQAFIVHGFDGMDEITISNNSYLLTYTDNNKISEEIINPQNYGIDKEPLESIVGGDVKYNTKKLIALLQAEKSAYRNIVILNAAFALKAAKKTDNTKDAIQLASEAIDSGSAYNLLEKLRK